jgi:hypothetical protein
VSLHFLYAGLNGGGFGGQDHQVDLSQVGGIGGRQYLGAQVGFPGDFQAVFVEVGGMPVATHQHSHLHVRQCPDMADQQAADGAGAHDADTFYFRHASGVLRLGES